MTVEARFVVIRNGVEVETFMDKKSADEHDRMLDIAENIAELLAESPIEINNDERETLSVYLAKQRDKLLYVLQAKKTKPAKKEKSKEVDVALVTDETNNDLKEAS